MIRTIALIFLMVAFISCNTTDGGRPYKSDVKIFAEDPDIIGKITHISSKRVGEDSLFTILVEENSVVNEPLEPRGKKISFTLWGATEIFIHRENRNIYYYNREDLKVDQIVRGWLMNGVTLTSYPSQGGAKRILVIEE